MEIRFPLYVKINTNDISTFADIGEQISKQSLNNVALERAIRKIDEMDTTRLAGKKYSRSNHSDFNRAGSVSSSFLSNFGRIKLRLNRVEKQGHGQIVLQHFLDNGDVQLSKDCEDNLRFLVSQLTFRRSARVLNMLQGPGFNKDVLWELVRKLGISSSETYDANPNDYDIIVIDGSGKKGKEWFVVIGINSKTMEKTLLHHSVGLSVKEIKAELDSKKLISKEKHIVVADGETQIHTAFKGYRIQLCAWHFEGTILYHLWKGGMSKKERNEVQIQIKSILNTLKNSVIKNAKRGKINKTRVEKKIKSTKNSLEKLAKQLIGKGYKTAHNFIKKHLDTVTLFAKEAIELVKIPWTNNIMERLMGEIAFRVKNIWAHWSKEGLNSIIHLILTDYCKRGVSK